MTDEPMVSLQRADDSGSQRLIEAKRIADRKGSLANLEVLRGANRNRRRQRLSAGRFGAAAASWRSRSVTSLWRQIFFSTRD
jgi:hypothetical protein